MARIGLNVPEDIYDELVEEAKQKDVPLSTVVRSILKKHAEKKSGKTLSPASMSWGGNRKPRKTA